MSTIEAPAKSETTQQVFQETRIIRASRSKVFEAWTSPDILQKWFGPPNMYCSAASTNLRVGGTYRLEVSPDPKAGTPTNESGSRVAVATGSYTQFVPDELLQFTWTPSWLPEENSLVTITLRDVEEGTEITLRHERFLPESNIAGYERGWSGSFEKLITLLQAS